MRRRLILPVVTGLLFAAMAAADDRAASVIAFGSCVRQDRPQPIWDAVLAQRPDVFLLMGDNIYGDSRDVAVLRAKYDQQAGVPGFAKLRGICQLMATWDDHDYGENDAGVEFPIKEESKRAFLDFLGEPADSLRRAQGGIQSARVFGEPGRRVQVILLDTRWGRTALASEQTPENKQQYVATTIPAARVLDDDQWAWLEARLREPAELRLVGSSIQIVSDDHPFEKWANFPAERERFFALIRDTGAGGVVILSGDRHFANLARLDDRSRVPYPLYDFTASGMTHSFARGSQGNDRHRLEVFTGENFGVVRVDWQDAGRTTVTLEARDVNGVVQFAHVVNLADLSSR